MKGAIDFKQSFSLYVISNDCLRKFCKAVCSILWSGYSKRGFKLRLDILIT